MLSDFGAPLSILGALFPHWLTATLFIDSSIYSFYTLLSASAGTGIDVSTEKTGEKVSCLCGAFLLVTVGFLMIFATLTFCESVIFDPG